MRISRIANKVMTILAAALFAVGAIFSQSASLRAAASGSSPADIHDEERGLYRYQFEGKVTNPCNISSVREKANVIGEFWFQFTYIDNNGTGEKRTEKFDMSYNGSGNNNSDFLNEHFIRGDDDEKNLLFNMYLPGQLTKMDIFLELNGSVGWFNYERMSFRIDTVTANGIKVNTTSDSVSSSTGSSTAAIYFKMEKPDSLQLSYAFDAENVTMREFIDMRDSGKLGEMNIADKYGTLLTEEALTKLTESPDSKVNQGFAHSDEAGMYLYTLKMLIENPVNVTNSGGDAIEEFIIDFTYDGNEHYKFDMSWDSARGSNRNNTFAELFRRPNDDETTAEMSLWIPGKVSKVNILLNMAGGEKLSVTFSDILLAGFKVNRKTDYVSSVYYDSTAEIECSVPEMLIDLGGLSDERIKEVMDIIYKNDVNADLSGITDQLGSPVGSAQLKAAHDEMMKCLKAADNDTRAVYADVIEGFYMFKTIYRAERLNAVQDYILEKRAAARKDLETAN